MQTRVGSITHIAEDKATPETTHMAESMTESEGGKTVKETRSGRGGNLVCFLILLNLALDQRDKGFGRWTRVYYKVLGIILLL